MTASGTPAAADLGPYAWLERERGLVDRALAEVAADAVRRAPPGLAEAMGYALSTSGKRLRPVLFLAAYRAVGGPDPGREALYRLACAVEVVHTYSLVHDDLPSMDDDDLRRGRPTVHRVHGVPRAVLAGAALLPLAVSVALGNAPGAGVPDAAAARLVVELCRAAGAEGMAGGQLLDLEAEQRSIDAAELEAIHAAKTGALLTASLRMGAIAGGAGEEALGALTRYGRALGIAFQIVDDVLDVTGDAQSLGKTAGRDQALSKASYPSLHGLEGARALARDRVAEAKAALARLPSRELESLADYVLQRRS